MEIYLEGNVQYSGFFRSSLIVSNIISDITSFKTFIIYSLVTKENFETTSKSKNNVINIIQITDMVLMFVYFWQQLLITAKILILSDVT